jgi:hypothetical protein
MQAEGRVTFINDDDVAQLESLTMNAKRKSTTFPQNGPGPTVRSAESGCDHRADPAALYVACAIALRKLGIGDTAAAFALMSAAVIATGALSYLWIEKPLLAIFKQLLFKPTPAIYPHAANTASQ